MADHPELWTEKTPSLRRERGAFLTYLCLPWSYGDRDPGSRWHRVQCRRRRHELNGGHIMHVDGTVVLIERRCRWCGSEAGDASAALPAGWRALRGLRPLRVRRQE